MNELERLLRLLRSANANTYRIETRSGVAKARFEGDTVDETLQAFEERFEHLFPDTYIVKYRDRSKTNEKGQESETFVIRKNDSETTNRTSQIAQNAPKMDSQLLQYFMEFSQKLGKMETELEYLKKTNDKLERVVEDMSKKLNSVYEDLTDEDPKNDKSAIDKLGDIMMQAPKLAEGIKSFRDLK